MYVSTLSPEMFLSANICAGEIRKNKYLQDVARKELFEWKMSLCESFIASAGLYICADAAKCFSCSEYNKQKQDLLKICAHCQKHKSDLSLVENAPLWCGIKYRGVIRNAPQQQGGSHAILQRERLLGACVYYCQLSRGLGQIKPAAAERPLSENSSVILNTSWCTLYICVNAAKFERRPLRRRRRDPHFMAVRKII